MEKSKSKKKAFTKNTVAQNRLKGKPNKGKAAIALTLLMLGIAFMPTGFLLSNYVQYQLDEGINDNVKVPHPHNPEFEEWESNHYDDAVPKYKTFYMWNLTNSEVYLGGGTPEYEEVGPFVYRQYDFKYDVSFSDSKDEVSYKEFNTYIFEEGKSVGNPLEVNITNINPAYMGVLGLAGDEASLIKAMFTSILSEVKAGVIDEIGNQLAGMQSLEFEWKIFGFTVLAFKLPEPDEIFYKEWADDLFSPLTLTLLGIDIPIDITNLFDVVGEIDIESKKFGVEGTNPSDINMTDRSVGLSGLEYEDCVKLWDPEDPLSLTGMDVKVDPIWFEALEDIGDSQQILKSHFDISDYSLNIILNWIDQCINDWLKNVCEYQIAAWNSGLITTRTVDEWLFTAVDNLINEMDPVMAKVGIFDNCHNITEAEEAETVQVKVKTGRDDIDKVGQYVEYDGNEDIMVWAEPLELTGTDGTQFAPGVSKDEKVEAFVDDIMRVGEFKYSKEVELHGINLYRFKLKDDLFDPNPICFMDTQGVANMEPVMGIPARVTKPHFFDADKSLLSKVDGMSPKSSEHDTFLDIEPISGAVMRARKRLQVNLYVTPTDQWYQDVSTTIMPILWVQESGEIPKDLAEEFVDVVYGALELKESLPLICIGIGAALFVPGAAVSTTQSVKRKKSKISNDLTKNKALAKRQSLTKSSKSQGIETLQDENQRKFSTLQNLK